MFDFSSLIDVLMRRAREEEPQGPSFTQLIVELPAEDTLAAMIEINKALAALNRNPRLSLKERYQSVRSCDEKARPLTALLSKVYHGEEQIEQILPHQVMPTLLACWKELASAYKLCLKQHAQAPSPKFEQEAQLITLRAIIYYSEQAKWSYLRYFDAEPRLWRSLNNLYQIAEAAGFADKMMAPYPDMAATSVSRVYRHALLLKLSEPERHRIEEIWMLDQLLDMWVDDISLERVIRPRDQSFAINLDEPKPPMKLRRNMVGERYRYFDTETLADRLAQASVFAAQGVATVPIMTEQLDHPRLARFLGDLSVVYSRVGQSRARRSERRLKDRPADAAIGFDVIHTLLAHGRGTSNWEPWNLLDESGNGFGAQYRSHYDDRLTIGELLALRSGDTTWLALVRRLHKSSEGNVRVGAERLAAQPAPVMLAGGSGNVPALYCAESPHGRVLVMNLAQHEAGALFTLASGTKRFTIKLGPALEVLPTCAICNFNVLAKD
ncbi:hypothetical protein [Chitinimonas sp. BJYL2]|uniref:hypothetical protein n=1 Tax=Chitinimonas sp. BJYL2 TaxID=2976696 RepID=UPI0022B3BF66|nr:hypothetical protein [Chitinimonas sp. BJYL2]